MSESWISESLQKRLGHQFRDLRLLETALTHRSFYFENRATSSAHYERLEFLGDAVLALVLSEALMKGFPEVKEGTLSKWRASLVNEGVLSEIARTLELGKELRLGKSEEKERENLRPRLLASALESVIAALYLDGGLECARAFLDSQFAVRLATLDATNEFAADFKTRLQELTQKRFHNVPEYRLVSSEGPEHAKNFVYEVWINGEARGTGSGSSRKSAEQNAARDALSKEDAGSPEVRENTL
jgi:ribonuclease III